jgi:hypothetical protein
MMSEQPAPPPPELALVDPLLDAVPPSGLAPPLLLEHAKMAAPIPSTATREIAYAGVFMAAIVLTVGPRTILVRFALIGTLRALSPPRRRSVDAEKELLFPPCHRYVRVRVAPIRSMGWGVKSFALRPALRVRSHGRSGVLGRVRVGNE